MASQLCDLCGELLLPVADDEVVAFGLTALRCGRCNSTSLLPDFQSEEEVYADQPVQTEFHFHPGSPDRRGLLYGWRPGKAERWGSWSCDEWAAFEINVPKTDHRMTFDLAVECPPKTQSSNPLFFEVYVQERFCGNFILTSSDKQTVKGRFPLTGAQCGGRVTIEFHFLDSLHGANDKMIGLKSCTIDV